MKFIQWLTDCLEVLTCVAVSLESNSFILIYLILANVYLRQIIIYNFYVYYVNKLKNNNKKINSGTYLVSDGCINFQLLIINAKTRFLWRREMTWIIEKNLKEV